MTRSTVPANSLPITFWLIASPVEEGSILTHVAHVRRDEDEPLRAIAPQRLGSEHDCEQLFVRDDRAWHR